MNETVVSIENVSKYFGEVAALSGVNAEVGSGDIIAVLGLNGAGKTTLLETLLGFSLPDDGVIRIFQEETRLLANEKLKKRIGFVPQQEELLPSMRVDHYLSLIGSFYSDWDVKLVDRLCEEWQLPTGKKIRGLSVGQRQKVAIISAIGFQPDLLVLDEPVASLDPKARRQFLREVIRLTDGNGCTVLFSTHIVGDVERLANRLWMLKGGRLSIDTTLDDIKENTVRLHVPTSFDLTARLTDLTVINRREVPPMALITVTGWNSEVESHFRRDVSDDFVIEPLSLEDIFLEINA